MLVRLLGTGDAIGTPKVGCPCLQCQAALAAGRERLRTSLLVAVGGKRLLVDTGPDLRRQLLAAGSPRIDAVVWTHGHFDHVMGFGEFYRVQKVPPVHAAPPVIEQAGALFSYLSFERHPHPPGVPFELCGARVTLVPVNHPPMPTFGLRVEADGAVLAYTADTRADIPEESATLLSGADLLLVDAIAPAGYHISKHMTYDEALVLADRLRPKEYRCVHIAHLLPRDLPHLGRDGETFVLGAHTDCPAPAAPAPPSL
ncbi:MAG: MBL fold metallo-hydrolase [Methanospirillum sp.]|nr:MBL fold metallo-hydrolase [Methanospirillum sp.]